MKTPAKINLFLRITGCRPDGYHELDNLFLPLPELADDIEVAWTEGPETSISLHSDTPGVPADSRNLCWRAAESFIQATGRHGRIEMTLHKHIPAAAGLGGGSSDAAAVLRCLNAMTGTPLSAPQLAAVAVRLGADVPFFLHPEPALGRGVGERLVPAAMAARLGVLLMNPGFPVSAAWSYQHWRPTPSDATPDVDGLLKAMAAGDLPAVAAACFNDLEASILDKFPLLQMIRAAFLKCGCLCSHVSGSGPTVFALCRPEQLDACAASMHDAFPDFFLSATLAGRDATQSGR